MGSSQTLVATGLRTAPRAGWRSGIATAFAVVAGRPSLWLIGGLGFACRGGIAVLALPMLVVPTPVEVRLLLGESLGSAGLTPEFFAALVPVAAVGAVLGLIVLVLIAQSELAAFERFVADPESAELRDRHEPHALTAAARRRVLVSLFVIECLAVLAMLIAALPLARAVGEVTLQELLRPSPGNASLYSRVLFGVREPLLVLLPAIVLVDAFSATAARRLLASAFGLAPAGRTGGVASLWRLVAEPIRHPLRVAGTSVLGWTISLGVLLPAAWALTVAAEATRATHLAPHATDPEIIPAVVVMTLVFVAVWVAIVLLAGFVSAVRAALWTAETLH